MFDAHLRRRFGDFLGEVDGGRPALHLSAQPAARRAADRARASPCVGDAAHAVHPIAGQGLNMGLKDVAALAEVLVEAARLGEDIGSEAVLERYARWRRVDNLARHPGHRRLHPPVLQRQSRCCALARGAGMAAVNRIGPARRFFMTEAGGAAGDLPRLLRGELV